VIFKIEKSQGTGKHRYLTGVATGPRKDSHGERMSENCLKSIIRQAREKDVLLFSDVHGIKESEDIGILKSLKQLDNGDFYVEFRLYDDTDDVDTKSRETATKLWNQVNGLPPYTKPRQKGFSIEGYLPLGRDDLEEKKEEHGIIDDMVLEGFVVVPEPAYKDSEIEPIRKSKELRMDPTKTKIAKALTPEEIEMINNIESLISQIKAGGDASGIEEEVTIEAAAPPTEETIPPAVPAENEEELLVEKDESGRSTADQRIGTLDKDDDEALSVLKSLFSRVKKSTKMNENTQKYFKASIEVMKNMCSKIAKQAKRLDEQEQAINGIMEGIGITEDVIGVQKQEKNPVHKSALSPDAEAIIHAMMNMSRVEKSARSNGVANDENSGLRDIMSTLFR
jgi:hypothetical protein